jgi:hypothetical protein
LWMASQTLSRVSNGWFWSIPALYAAMEQETVVVASKYQVHKIAIYP